jgi:hypothetical protein
MAYSPSDIHHHPLNTTTKEERGIGKKKALAGVKKVRGSRIKTDRKNGPQDKRNLREKG